MLFISHDLGVIAQMCDRVAVMYAGQIVETATTKDLFASPRHPYTRGLLRSIPHLDGRQERLEVIPGRVPEATSLPFGCRFHPRCSLAESACEATDQSLEECGADHEVRCRRWSGDV